MRSNRSPGLRVVDLRALAEEDPETLPADDLRARVLELADAITFLQGQLTRAVAVFDARGLSVDDGCRSTRSWLRNFAGLSESVAGDHVRAARTLRQLPALAQANREGRLTTDHVRHVARLVQRVGVDPVKRVEPVLVDAAVQLDAAGFARVCDRVRAHVDPDGDAGEAAKDFDRRYLTVAPVDGMVLLRGQLDPEGGAALMTALDALMPAPAAGDPRLPGQRRADALAQLARDAMAGDRLPASGGMHPQVGILVTPAQLIGHGNGEAAAGVEGAPRASSRVVSRVVSRVAGMATGAVADAGASAVAQMIAAQAVEAPWLNWVGDVPVTTAQRIACDADVWRIVLDPATGQPLDVGRRYRLVPHWIRRALGARDRGCRFPGCDAPFSWTHAHHLVPWSRGGPTDLDNLASLCPFHHALVHEHGWSIRLNQQTGELTATRPDGSPYDVHNHRLGFRPVA